MICPFCGHTQRPGERCQDCQTSFDASSRRAAAESIGPWFVRDTERPFQPGCTYEEIRRRVHAGSVSRYTIVRGPTTRQLWTVARHVPGIAHLLGYCHACDAPVDPSDPGCRHCGAPFAEVPDRDSLGLESAETSRAVAPGRSVGFVPGFSPRLSAFAPDEELLDPALGTTGPSVEQAANLAATVTTAQARGGGGALRGGASDRAGACEEDGPPSLIQSQASPSVSLSGRSVSRGPSEFALASIERSLRSALRRQRVVSGVLGAMLVVVLGLALLIALRVPGRPGGAMDAGRPGQQGPEGAGTRPSVEKPSTAGADASTGPSREAPGTDAATGSTGSRDTLAAVDAALDALAADRGADPEDRRRRLKELADRLDRLAAVAPAGLEATRRRLEEIRAEIELDAVLPPEQPVDEP